VEWICRTSTIMAGAQYGYIIRVLFHPVECDLFGDFYAGFRGTSTFVPGTAGQEI
jgi:hypothetical protein